MSKVAIIGAGVSGLSLAKKLLEKGIQPTIYEKESEIGGLCRTSNINGYIYDLCGGHVFNSKYEDIKEWVFSMLPIENWQYSVRKAKIIYNNKIIDYPFELSLSQLDENEEIDCLVDFLQKRNDVEPDNFYDWLIWAFGESIAEKYMIPYNTKIWNYDLKDMSIDWVKGKMPIPTIKQLITSVIKKDSKEFLMPHSTYYYPLKGGISTLVYAIANGLDDIRINEPVISIEKKGKQFIINGKDYFDVVINTAPLKELVGVIKPMPKDIENAINDLKYNSIKTVLFQCPRDNDFSWVYIPDLKIKPHRVVYQGNFSIFNTPYKNESSVTVEVIGNYPTDLIINEIKKVFEVGEPITEYYTKYAYVIYDKNRSNNINKIKSFFNDLNIKLLGRFAEWEYPNMDICMKKAFELAEIIFRS